MLVGSITVSLTKNFYRLTDEGNTMKIGNNFPGFERSAARKPHHKEVKPDIETSLVKETKQAESQKSESKGVIRHIEEGHFKGVADVRLRLNFQDELNAIQQGKETALVTQAASDLSSTASLQLETIIGETQLDAEQASAAKEALAAFESDVENVIANATDPQTGVDELRSAADAFLSTLNDLVATPPISSPIETDTQIDSETEAIDAVIQIETEESANPPIVIEEPTIEIVSTVDGGNELEPGEEIESVTTVDDDATTGLFDELASEVDDLFKNLQLSLLETELPEPTNPKGNGVAFEKFLAIYRQNQ